MPGRKQKESKNKDLKGNEEEKEENLERSKGSNPRQWQRKSNTETEIKCAKKRAKHSRRQYFKSDKRGNHRGNEMDTELEEAVQFKANQDKENNQVVVNLPVEVHFQEEYGNVIEMRVDASEFPSEDERENENSDEETQSEEDDGQILDDSAFQVPEVVDEVARQPAHANQDTGPEEEAPRGFLFVKNPEYRWGNVIVCPSVWLGLTMVKFSYSLMRHR